MTVFELSDSERTTLQNILDDEKKLLAQRAHIILLSEDGRALSTIAQEVGVTPRTVRRWRKRFGEKRIDIFPQRAVTAHAPENSKAGQPDEDQPGAKKPLPAPVEHVAGATSTSTPTEEGSLTSQKDKKKQNKKTKPEKEKKQVELPTRKNIGLQEKDAFAEAGRKVLSFHFARMLAHESGTRLGEDIEELHDMRVATRRMRAAFRVFGEAFSGKKAKAILAGLKATGRALGPVRDLDVFIQKLQEYQESLSPEHQAELQTFLDIWDEKRQDVRKTMLKYLKSKEYRRFKRVFLEFATTEGMAAKPVPEKVPPLPNQLRHIAPALIYETYAQVRAFETILDNATIDTLHQLRISFKRLRYTLEFLDEILGDGKEIVIKKVKQLQNHLGDLNDADVASNIINEFLADWEAHQLHLPLEKRQSPSQMVAYLNVQLEKRHKLLVTFPEAWQNFNQPELRESLGKAISIL